MWAVALPPFPPLCSRATTSGETQHALPGERPEIEGSGGDVNATIDFPTARAPPPPPPPPLLVVVVDVPGRPLLLMPPPEAGGEARMLPSRYTDPSLASPATAPPPAESRITKRANNAAEIPIEAPAPAAPTRADCADMPPVAASAAPLPHPAQWYPSSNTRVRVGSTPPAPPAAVPSSCSNARIGMSTTAPESFSNTGEDRASFPPTMQIVEARCGTGTLATSCGLAVTSPAPSGLNTLLLL